jgi:hypothetical protein
MSKKDAEEIAEYSSYEKYKTTLKKAEHDFNQQWSNNLVLN